MSSLNNEDDNEISILIATDNHLGYMDKNPIRGNDSIKTFEEILVIAQKKKVDFILLGGDLFHDNKPQRKTLYQTMALFRQYCFGDRACKLDFLSDQSVNFQDKFGVVNYQDPNLNVSMPVFSIHGNHDDPSGDGRLCPLDLLSVSGFVNYFGKVQDVDDITLSPILLKKGTTNLALYGLGNVRDERLNRTFRRRNVKILRPSENQEDWFNIMVLHQNRVAHGPKNYIPENFLDDFLQFVIWGHEHECKIDPSLNPQQGFYVTQPGSSIATSLCEGESQEKYVGLLKIRNTAYKFEKIKLTTVRPFIMSETVLSADLGSENTSEDKVTKYLKKVVIKMIEEAKNRWKSDNPTLQISEFPLPLIRLKVEYGGGFVTTNPQRFGQDFVKQVANPKDILLFYRKKTFKPASGTNNESPSIPNVQIPAKLDTFRVEDLVEEYLNAQNLKVLPENKLGEAVKIFVEKDDKDAIKEFVKESIEITKNLLSELNLEDTSEDLIKGAELVKKRMVRDFNAKGVPLKVNTKKSKRDAGEVFEEEKANTRKKVAAKPANKAPKTRKRKAIDTEDEEEDEEEEEEEESEEEVEVLPKKRGRGAAKPVAAKKSSTGKGKSKALDSEVEGEENEVDNIVDSDLMETIAAKTKSRSNKVTSTASSRNSSPPSIITQKRTSRKIPFGLATKNNDSKKADGFKQSKICFTKKNTNSDFILDDE
ncbi:meiotic recombination [Lobulomyces angularis]|nr:meiotic recombination [Lobulomyces angularis]